MTLLTASEPLVWPPFPKLPPDAFLENPQHNRSVRYLGNSTQNFRERYDWTIYTPEALKVVEANWDACVELVAGLLPERLRRAPSSRRGINLGTFNGAFQKAWMRRGYSMYGIELVDVIGELHQYGCEGHQDDIHKLEGIEPESFDFAVLDRVICTKGYYEHTKGRARHFDAIVRSLKKDGVLVGVLYSWYTAALISELASYGGLRIWGFKNLEALAFTLDLTQPPTAIAAPSAADAGLFQTVKDGRRRYLPTNELLDERGASLYFPEVPGVHMGDK